MPTFGFIQRAGCHMKHKKEQTCDWASSVAKTHSQSETEGAIVWLA
jgi:hypothetical protein